jgi:hypothetical protein
VSGRLALLIGLLPVLSVAYLTSTDLGLDVVLAGRSGSDLLVLNVNVFLVGARLGFAPGMLRDCSPEARAPDLASIRALHFAESLDWAIQPGLFDRCPTG